VVAKGTPEQVAAKAGRSYTGSFLAGIVEPAKRRQRPKVAAAA